MAILNNLFSLLILIPFISCLENENTNRYLENYTHAESEKINLFTYTESEHLKNKIPSVSLIPEKVYEYVENPDSPAKSKIYFQNVFSISSIDKGYLVNDAAGGRILYCDKNFKLFNIIGRKGIGPGEFSQPRYSILEDGLVYSSGTSNRGFAVHDLNGRLITNFKSNAPDYNPILSKFTVFDAQIFHSTPNSKSLINAIDTLGNVINSFGNKISGFSKENKKVLNGGHLVKNDNNSFYFIAENAPIIQKYSKSGQLTTTHNLIDHPYFETFFKGVQERQRISKRNDMEYLLSQDVQLYNNKLYILMYAYDTDFKISLQKVLVINLNNDKNLILEKEIVLNLPETADHPAWFESISVSDSKIIAFESISGNFLEYSF